MILDRLGSGTKTSSTALRSFSGMRAQRMSGREKLVN
jgi:hypothetical protein